MLYESKLRALMKNAMTRQVILLIQNFRYSISTVVPLQIYTYIHTIFAHLLLAKEHFKEDEKTTVYGFK